jgi:predicted SnoaL-like aldol condensation-catalyzing enzyme
LNNVQMEKDAAVEFLGLVASGKVREAYEKHVGAGFRHHNPYFRGDAASLMEAMEQNAAKNPNKLLEIQSAIQEGDRVAVFSRVRQNPQDRGGAVVHIFRFERGRIVEFWDVGQAVPEQSVNENGMF